VARRARNPLENDVVLRDVTEGDLPVFFEHQLDPEATRMADFPARDKKAFLAHWNRILGDESIMKKTILYVGEVAGNVVSFVHAGKREVGYWVGKEYWGRGVATRALSELLDLEERRPLYAYVAKHNVASIRVLQKCGFEVSGEEGGDVVLRLGATDGARSSRHTADHDGGETQTYNAATQQEGTQT
jgi:RimJ/RimL family protein N-acetyltransferase